MIAMHSDRASPRDGLAMTQKWPLVRVCDFSEYESLKRRRMGRAPGEVALV
jgi:hypothetical protein